MLEFFLQSVDEICIAVRSFDKMSIFLRSSDKIVFFSRDPLTMSTMFFEECRNLLFSLLFIEEKSAFFAILWRNSCYILVFIDEIDVFRDLLNKYAFFMKRLTTFTYFSAIGLSKRISPRLFFKNLNSIL